MCVARKQSLGFARYLPKTTTSCVACAEKAFATSEKSVQFPAHGKRETRTCFPPVDHISTTRLTAGQGTKKALSRVGSGCPAAASNTIHNEPGLEKTLNINQQLSHGQRSFRKKGCSAQQNLAMSKEAALDRNAATAGSRVSPSRMRRTQNGVADPLNPKNHSYLQVPRASENKPPLSSGSPSTDEGIVLDAPHAEADDGNSRWKQKEADAFRAVACSSEILNRFVRSSLREDAAAGNDNESCSRFPDGTKAAEVSYTGVHCDWINCFLSLWSLPRHLIELGLISDQSLAFQNNPRGGFSM